MTLRHIALSIDEMTRRLFAAAYLPLISIVLLAMIAWLLAQA